MKRILFLGFSLFLTCALATAAVHARYRIELRNGSHVFSKDLPVHRGSVVTFHRSPGGALTGVPEEDVLRVQTGAVDVSERVLHVLQPSDVVVRGQASVIETTTPVLEPGDVVYLGSTAVGPNGMPIVPSSTDLARARAAGQTVAPNGFPATTASPTMIGPDGTPVLAPGGTPDSVPLTIGPNGTPLLAPAAPGSVPTIGPNGTPTLAQPGAPGSTPPTIGPNGTPVTAPGVPATAVGPNGFPAPGPPR